MKLINRVGKYLQPGRSWNKRSVAGITHLVVHHSVTYTAGKTNDQMVQELANIHWQNGWPGLSYNRVITPDGTVYQINNVDDLTWTDSHNTDSLAVCMIGYFHSPANMKPTPAQLKALKECLDEWTTEHPEFPADKDDVWGHRDRWATACPGDLVYPYPTEYRTKLGQVDWGTNAPAPVPTPPSGECLLLNTEENRKSYEHLVQGATVRKEVAEYLEIPNPDHALKEAFTKVIGGIKSTISALQTKLNGTEQELAKANNEISNRIEQVGRLEVQVTESAKRENSLLKQLDQAAGNTAQAVRVVKEQLDTMTRARNEEAKAKGRALNDLAKIKKELELCQKGTHYPSKSFLEIIKDLFGGGR